MAAKVGTAGSAVRRTSGASAAATGGTWLTIAPFGLGYDGVRS